MFSFDAASIQHFQAEYGLLQFCIVMVAFNFFLFTKLISERRNAKALKKLLRNPEKYILEFLASQFNLTRNFNRVPENINKKLNKEVAQLRTAYLKIEEKAIGKKMGSDGYWQYLDENISRLIKIIFPKIIDRNTEFSEIESRISLLTQRITNIPNSTNNKKVEANKAKAIASLLQIRDRYRASKYDRGDLDRQVKKLESIINIFESPENRTSHLIQKSQQHYLDNSGKHLGRLDQLSDLNDRNIANFQKSAVGHGQLSDELLNFKTENELLSTQIRKLKAELDTFKTRNSIKDSLVNINQTNEKKIHPYEFGDISQELIESNEREINRLREVIDRQRHSIFEMEESLNQLEKINQSENWGHQHEIENLKRCIAESEVCISMLEKELDELRDNIAELKESRGGTDLSLAASQELDEEVKHLKTMMEQSNTQVAAFEQLNQYVSNALSAGSIEDIALLVYETIVSLNYMPTLLIKAPDRTLELSNQGEIPIREKALIDSMQINEVNPGRKGELNFRFLQISGVVRAPFKITSDENEKQFIIQILKLTDKILVLANLAQRGKQQSKVREEIVNSIKHASYDLDKLIEDQNKTTKKIISNGFQKISDLARVRGMNATQVAAISVIGQEAMKQVDAANTLRLKSRKDFLALINLIESSA